MKNVKRILVIAIMSILVVSLCATMFSCSNNDEDAAAKAAVVVDTTKSEYVVGICQLLPHPALDAATEGFMNSLTAELAKAGRTVRFDRQSAAGESTNCTTIVNKFVADKVDLMMANATPALQAAVNATETIPVLGTSVTDYATALGIKSGWTGTVGTSSKIFNVSGTSDCAPLDQQAAMILELFPTVKKVGLVYCSAESNSKFQCDKVAAELKNHNVNTQTFTFSDSNDIAAVINSACANSEVLYIPTDNTAANNTSIIAANATKPIICGEEGIAGGCGLATLSISYYDLGVATGVQAAKILLGEVKIYDLAIGYVEPSTLVKKYVPSRAGGITIPSSYVAIE